MTIRPAAPTSLLLLLIGASPAFADSDTVLGHFNAWEAHKLERDNATTCYAISKPKSSSPKSAKRDPAYFLITNWSDRPSKTEPSIVAGYVYDEGSNVAVQVGKAKFSFFTKGDGAWLESEADERRLIAAMKKASAATVTGTSARGTKTTDRYSLAGLPRALDKIAKACK
jgi:hypothetical protein